MRHRPGPSAEVAPEIGTELYQLYHEGAEVVGMAWSPDGEGVATAGGEGPARLWTSDAL